LREEGRREGILLGVAEIHLGREEKWHFGGPLLFKGECRESRGEKFCNDCFVSEEIGRGED
jgi:hypothetical protein